MRRRFVFTVELFSHETYEGDIMYRWRVPDDDGTVWKAEVSRIVQETCNVVCAKAQAHHP